MAFNPLLPYATLSGAEGSAAMMLDRCRDHDSDGLLTIKLRNHAAAL